MSAPDSSEAPVSPSGPARPSWPVLARKGVIWCLFLALVYVARDFFFTAFMTFLVCYLTLAVVGWGMRRLAPDRDRPGLRRLLTAGVFAAVPVALLGVGYLVAPRLLEQGQRLAGWLTRTSPEAEVAHVVERFVGPREFRRRYPSPQDPGYRKDLEEFRARGETHVASYQEFPKLEAWVEGGFARRFAEAERGRVRARLLREGTSSREFEEWFLRDKFPELRTQARAQVPAEGRPPAAVDPLVRAASSDKPEQVLEQARRDPAALAALRKEWVDDTLAKDLAAAPRSAAYREEFERYYEDRRAKSPGSVPYTFEQYLALRDARPRGPKAFGEAYEKLFPTPPGEGEDRLRADFRAAREHELFQEWWGGSAPARFLRHQVEAGAGGGGRMERVLSSLLDVPVDLGTALLLSLFICLDFDNLRRAVRRLRETWLRDVYDEMAPALSDLGRLVGKAMHAQGLIALCNALLLGTALWLLGVEHEVLLAGAVFVLCLVPTLGTLLAWVLIVAVALVQPGGGLVLALKASLAVLFVVLMETFVFSPRILGRMMELHPVLIIAILPVAQYFFGVWGLILATPVAVYVVYVLILREGLPGTDPARQAAADEPGPREPGARPTAAPTAADRAVEQLQG
jgi:predicted PurR-regulated permease PerM